METCISNMLFDYRLNLKNLCITQFADLLQRTRRTAMTMRTKRVPVHLAMTVSAREKKKRPKGKMAEEPPMIPFTIEELNHVLDKWIRDGIVRHLLYPSHLLKKKERTFYFARFITMSNTLPRTVGAFVGFFIRSLQRESWSSLKRNLKCKGTLYPITRERE